jgi:hypothetical protein
MRWVIVGVGLVAGVALLAAGATLIGVVLVVLAGLRIAMLVAVRRRAHSFRAGGETAGGRRGELLQRLARNELDVAATAIGIAPDDLRRAVENGRTISAVAADEGISTRQVVAAVVRDASAKVDRARRGRERGAEPGARRAQPAPPLGRALRVEHSGDARGHAARLIPARDRYENPVSRTVMLSRPAGRPSPAGAVPGSTFGTPWNPRRCSRPKTSRSPLRSSTSRTGPTRRSTSAKRKVQVSPRLSVTTGASDGSSPSWWSPSLAPSG